MQNEDDNITLEPIPTLSKLALPALNNVQMSDVIFHVGPNKVPVYAHSIILSLQSEYFKALLYGPWASAISKRGDHYIPLPEDSPEIFKRMVGFMYGEEITMPAQELFDVTLASRKYQIQALESECVRHLVRLLDTENACSLLSFAVRCNLSQLEEEAIELICRNGDEVLLNTRHLSCLDEESLSLILERDEICIDNELKLFESLIKWAHTRQEDNNNMHIDLTDPHIGHKMMLAEDPADIYKLISNMLNLIRFEQMTKKEMQEVIEPLKVVPMILLQTAVQRQSQEDITPYARCYTKMDQDVGQANKCCRCNTPFSARSEHDFCANTFFHPGYYCIFRKKWNCCETSSAEGSGCTGRFHTWTPAENVTTESQSFAGRPAVNNHIDFIGYRTI